MRFKHLYLVPFEKAPISLTNLQAPDLVRWNGVQTFHKKINKINPLRRSRLQRLLSDLFQRSLHDDLSVPE